MQPAVKYAEKVVHSCGGWHLQYLLIHFSLQRKMFMTQDMYEWVLALRRKLTRTKIKIDVSSALIQNIALVYIIIYYKN